MPLYRVSYVPGDGEEPEFLGYVEARSPQSIRSQIEKMDKSRWPWGDRWLIEKVKKPVDLRSVVRRKNKIKKEFEKDYIPF